MCETSCDDMLASIVDKLEVAVNHTNSLFSIRSTLEELTNAIETLSISIIFAGICHSFLKNKLNLSNKKSRRKKDSSTTTDSVLLSQYELLVTKLKGSATRIDTILKSVDILNVFSKCFVSTIFLVCFSKSKYF